MISGNGLGLGVSVFRDGKDCTNGGASAGEGRFFLFGRGLPLDGYMGLDDVLSSGQKPLWLDASSGGGHPIAVADPTSRQLGKVGGDASRLLGPMMGGNYVATSDSRFSEATRAYGAIPLHDRYETPDEYDALSR